MIAGDTLLVKTVFLEVLHHVTHVGRYLLEALGALDGVRIFGLAILLQIVALLDIDELIRLRHEYFSIFVLGYKK